MLIIPAFKRLKQEDLNFKSSLGYVVSSRPIWVTKQDCLNKGPKGAFLPLLQYEDAASQHHV
jgi:hypothetical protein